MPDSDGKLTFEEKERCAKWLSDKVPGDVTCPVCKTSKWEIADHLVCMSIFNPIGSTALLGTVYPFFQLCCSNCANTILINAVDAKIVADKPIPAGRMGE